MAYSFDGSNDYISAGDVLDRDWNEPWSIGFWMKAGSQSANKFVICKQQSSGNYTGYGAAMTSTHKIYAFSHSTVASYIYMIGNSNVNTNEWTHVLCTKNDASSTTSFKIYVNGVSETISLFEGGNHSGSTVSDANLSFGSRNNAELYFAGSLADVGIWDVEINADEAASLSKSMKCNRIRPQNLKLYAPLVRNVFDLNGGNSLTASGPTVADHPRIYG
jgi:hypothetical protein